MPSLILGADDVYWKRGHSTLSSSFMKQLLQDQWSTAPPKAHSGSLTNESLTNAPKINTKPLFDDHKSLSWRSWTPPSSFITRHAVTRHSNQSHAISLFGRISLFNMTGASSKVLDSGSHVPPYHPNHPTAPTPRIHIIHCDLLNLRNFPNIVLFLMLKVLKNLLKSACHLWLLLIAIKVHPGHNMHISCLPGHDVLNDAQVIPSCYYCIVVEDFPRTSCPCTIPPSYTNRDSLTPYINWENHGPINEPRQSSPYIKVIHQSR